MSCGAPPPTAPVGVAGALSSKGDLRQFINYGSVRVLNSDAKCSASSVLQGAGALRSDADVDQQLLISVPFTTPVNIASMRVVADKPRDAEESGPQSIKLFVNQSNLDFSDAESSEAAQALMLTEAQLKGASVTLKLAKFMRVHALAVFVATNQKDTAVTFLNNLSFIGSPADDTDMNKLCKVG